MAELTAKRSTRHAAQPSERLAVKDKRADRDRLTTARRRGSATARTAAAVCAKKLGVPSGQRLTNSHGAARGAERDHSGRAYGTQRSKAVLIYITHQPCGICAKMIVNAGIKRIVVRDGYPTIWRLEILEEAGLYGRETAKGRLRYEKGSEVGSRRRNKAE